MEQKKNLTKKSATFRKTRHQTVTQILTQAPTRCMVRIPAFPVKLAATTLQLGLGIIRTAVSFLLMITGRR